MMFKPGDLVTIIDQPKPHEPNSHINMKWLSGFIEEIKGNYAQFHELKEDGCGGVGAVPLNCLRLENDNLHLQLLKKNRDEYIEKIHFTNKVRMEKYNSSKYRAIVMIAKKVGLPTNKIMTIFKLYEEWKSEWDRNDY